MHSQDVTVSVVIVSYNTAHLLEELFSRLHTACERLTAQIIVIDNASGDQSVEILRSRYPHVELIANQTNVGFGRANNQALPLLRGKHVLLLNTDAFVAPDSIEKAIACMEQHADCGVLGVRLVGRDGALQPSCRYFASPLEMFLATLGVGRRLLKSSRVLSEMDWDHNSLRECDWVPGCFYLIRRSVVDQVGLFDPRYFLYFEEVDHCWAVKDAGWKVLYCPDTSVIHLGGESAKSDHDITQSGRQVAVLQIESELLFNRKHRGVLGVFVTVALTLLADALLALKAVVRGFDFRGAASYFKHGAAVLRLLGRTSLGKTPTR